MNNKENINTHNKNDMSCHKHKDMNSSHDHHNHDDHDEHIHSVGNKYISIKWKMVIGFLLLIPALWIMIYNISSGSVFIPWWIINPYFQLIIATISILVFSLNIFKNFIDELKHKKIGIDATISISIFVAYVFSLVMLIINGLNGTINDVEGSKYFFDAIVEIPILVFIGVIVDNYATKKAKQDITSIDEMIVKTALVIKDGKEVETNIHDIKIDDIIIVKAGERIALDGIVIEGKTEIDESAFTGESISVKKEIGSSVFGGSISQNGTVLVKVTSEVDEMMVSKILKGIDETRKSKPKSQVLANKIGNIFMPFLILTSLLGFLGWGIFTNDWYKAISVFITTMIIACPMAFVLITPFTTLFTNRRALQNNIQIQSKAIFENERDIDIIFFDKTGTLTEGVMDISQYQIDRKYDDIIFTMESNSTHSISQSIIKFLGKNLNKVEGEISTIPGKGLKLKTEKETYYIGSYKYANEFHKDFLYKINPGEVVSIFFSEKEILGEIILTDKVKETSRKAIAELKKMNIEVIMLTGDNEQSAKKIANELDITTYYSEMLPTDKVDKLEEYRKKGFNIGFVGDGINDSIAIESANLGIAMSSGTDVAKTTSDIIILDDDLISVVNTIILMKKANSTIKIGLGISIVWVIIAISFSLSGLIVPAFGAVGMIINDTLPLVYGTRMKFVKLKKFNDTKK